MTPSRELYQKILDLRAAQEEAALRSWRLMSKVRDKENELETEKMRVAMMIGLTAESSAKAARLEDMNADLKQRVEELEEENERLNEELDSWKCPNL